MTKSKASSMTKRKDAGRKTKSITRRRRSNAKLAEDCAIDLQLLVRLKAANKEGQCQCVSCGVVKHWSDMQGGHYMGRSAIATKLLEENIHPQCRRCNLRSSTSHVGYTLYMLDMYGKEFIEELKQMAARDFKWSRNDIEQLHSDIKKQIEYHKQRLEVSNGSN